MNQTTPKLFNTVSELKAAHDEQFIRLAYQVILDRKADPDGLIHYLYTLRRTINHAEFILEIDSSNEAKFIKKTKDVIQIFNQKNDDSKEAIEYRTAIRPILNTSIESVAAFPLVSIVILQYHKSNLTSNCIRSLLRYTDLSNTEIIVVDNGSPHEHISNLIDEFKSSIRIISIGINRYFGEGNNIGVEASNGEFVILMNNDIVVTHGWLDKLKVQITDNVGAVGPCFLYPDGRVQECGAFIHPDGFTNQQMKGLNVDVLPLFPFECDYISAALLMMRKESFLKVGGFDLCYEPAYYEDVDLCLKLRSFGLITLCVPDVRIFHNENATSSDKTLGLKLNNIVSINHKKFFDRWGAYLVDRSEDNLVSVGVIGSKSAQIKQLNSQLSDDNNPTALLYSPYSLTPGGGEKYLLTIAQELLRTYATTLVFPNLYSRIRLEQMAKYLDLDLTGLSLAVLDPDLINRKWDIAFILGNSISPPFSKLSLLSFYICQFPFDRSSFHGKKIPFHNEYQYLCYSDFVKNYISSDLPIDSFEVNVLPPAIQLFHAAKYKEKIIISVGRFFTGGHCKNQHLLIIAFGQLVKTDVFSDWKLILIGSTRPESEHREYYQHCLELANGLNVEIIPDASHEVLSNIYAKASIYWHGSGLGVDAKHYPEQAEHFGITPLEAASAGCLVFVPNVGGPCEIANKAPGNFYTYSDIDTLVKLMLQVCTSLASRSVSVNNMVDNYVKEFDITNFGNRLTKMIDDTLILKSIRSNESQKFSSDKLHFTGWGKMECDGYRWSEGYEAAIDFIWLENKEGNECLTFLCDTFNSRHIIIHLNGDELCDGHFNLKETVLSFDLYNLLLGMNRLNFSFPDACIAGNGDSRVVALAFRELKIRLNRSKLK